MALLKMALPHILQRNIEVVTLENIKLNSIQVVLYLYKHYEKKIICGFMLVHQEFLKS